MPFEYRTLPNGREYKILDTKNPLVRSGENNQLYNGGVVVWGKLPKPYDSEWGYVDNFHSMEGVEAFLIAASLHKPDKEK